MSAGLSPQSADLARAQAAHMHLLYSRKALEAFESDPEGYLRGWYLPSTWLRLFPNTRTDGFRTEVYGRRIQAAQELRGYYARTIQVLMNDATPDDRAVAEAQWLSAFLESSHFFETRHSLPHPSGIGRAYEGGTRFFFWARDWYGLRRDDADLKLRNELYLDFAALADALAFGASDEFYHRFDHGFFWNCLTNRTRRAYALAPDRRVLTVEGSDVVASLSSLGMIDLDQLEPA